MVFHFVYCVTRCVGQDLPCMLQGRVGLALEGAKSLQDIYQVSHLDFKELMDEASTPMERGIEGWVGKRPACISVTS